MREERLEEKELKEKKENSKVPMIVLIILLLIVIGLIGFILVDKGIIKLGDNEKAIVEEPVKKETIDKEELNNLLKNLYLLKNGKNRQTNLVYDSLYADDTKTSIAWLSISEGDFKKEYCPNLYSQDLYDEFYQAFKTQNGICKGSVNTISYEKLNEAYKKLFTDSVSRKGVSTTMDLAYSFIDYIAEKDLYVELECGGCGGTSGPEVLITEIKSQKLEDDILKVELYYFQSFSTSADENGNMKFEVYGNTVTATSEDYAEELIKKNYLDKLDVYTATFKKDDNIFKFDSLVKN